MDLESYRIEGVIEFDPKGLCESDQKLLHEIFGERFNLTFEAGVPWDRAHLEPKATKPGRISFTLIIDFVPLPVVLEKSNCTVPQSWIDQLLPVIANLASEELCERHQQWDDSGQSSSGVKVHLFC